MPCSQKAKTKQKQYCNNSIKIFKKIHIKKSKKKKKRNNSSSTYVVGIRKIYLEINTEKKICSNSLDSNSSFWSLTRLSFQARSWFLEGYVWYWERRQWNAQKWADSTGDTGKINHNGQIHSGHKHWSQLALTWTFLPSLSLWKASKYHAHTTILWGKMSLFSKVTISLKELGMLYTPPMADGSPPLSKSKKQSDILSLISKPFVYWAKCIPTSGPLHLLALNPDGCSQVSAQFIPSTSFSSLLRWNYHEAQPWLLISRSRLHFPILGQHPLPHLPCPVETEKPNSLSWCPFV